MCCREGEQDGGRVEKQRYDEDEVAHRSFVGAAEERCEVTHRAKVRFDGLSFAIHLRLLNAEISQCGFGRLALINERRPRRPWSPTVVVLVWFLVATVLVWPSWAMRDLMSSRSACFASRRASTVAALLETVTSPARACSMWARDRKP